MRTAAVISLLLVLTTGCGGSADSGPDQPARSTRLPAVEDAPPVDLSQPRAIAVIWEEVIARRAEIDRFLAEDRLLEIVAIADRLMLVMQELRGVGRDFDRVHQVRLLRLLNASMYFVSAVQELARIQIPGGMPLKLWDMDGALVAIEEALPEELRGGHHYPRPSAKPPV